MDSQSQTVNGIPNGQQKPSTTWGEFNNISFLVQQALAKMQTSTLVRIEKCTNNGGLSPVGFVDVTPLVTQIDGAGTPVPHVTIYNLPYFRLQGGANAIIIDPQPGDIGVAVFASRDISKVKSTKKQAPPGSFRQYSFSDGMYLGGMLNGTPTQYVQFNAEGITINSPALVNLVAPVIQLNAQTVTINASVSATVNTPTFIVNGDTQMNGTLNATGNIVGDGISLNTHTHTGVEPGGGNTGGPT